MVRQHPNFDQTPLALTNAPFKNEFLFQWADSQTAHPQELSTSYLTGFKYHRSSHYWTTSAKQVLRVSSLGTMPVYDPLSAVIYASSRENVTDIWVAGEHLF